MLYKMSVGVTTKMKFKKKKKLIEGCMNEGKNAYRYCHWTDDVLRKENVLLRGQI